MIRRTSKVDVLVLHLKLGVLDPHWHVPVVNFERALIDGAHSASKMSASIERAPEVDIKRKR